MSEWVTIVCERALVVDYGINTILCDRLPSNPTLVLKISDEELKKLVSFSIRKKQIVSQE